MTTTQLLQQIKRTDITKLGENPVVVLPLKVWNELEDRIEDLEIEESKKLAKKISMARLYKKLYSVSDTRKLLKL